LGADSLIILQKDISFFVVSEGYSIELQVVNIFSLVSAAFDLIRILGVCQKAHSKRLVVTVNF
jgi:hypothetical protein